MENNYWLSEPEAKKLFEAIGARSFFGVLGSRKSLPACDATFFEGA